MASATAAALLGLECDVYMGTVDIDGQALNVHRMKLLGAQVLPVESGTKTLKDAINEALRDWVTNVRTTYYLLGSVMGPHPYPTIVRDFQPIIGEEARAQSRHPRTPSTDLAGGVRRRWLERDRSVLALHPGPARGASWGWSPASHGIKSAKHGPIPHSGASACCTGA